MAMFSFLDHLNLIEDDSSQYEVAVGDNGFSYLNLMSEKQAKQLTFSEKQQRETSAALDGSTRARGQSNLKQIETIDHDEVCLDTDLATIVRDMEQRRKRFSLFPWAQGGVAGAGLLWMYWLWGFSHPAIPFVVSAFVVVPGAAFVLVNAWHLDRSRKDVRFRYRISGRGETAFAGLNAALEQLNASKQVLLNTGRKHFEDTRYSGGAGDLPELEPVKISRARPPLLDLDFDVWHLRVFNRDLFFMPDHVLVFDGAKMGGVNYANVDVTTDMEVTQARGRARVTPDVKVVGKTYRFVNNDGSADKRFNNNAEIPLIEFGVVKLMGAGLNLPLFVSNQTNAMVVPNGFSQIRNLASLPPVKLAEQRRAEASERRKVRQQELFSIVLDALCCVMFADGTASASERKKVQELMRRIRAPWDEAEVDSRVRQFCERGKSVGFGAMVDEICSRVATIKSPKQKDALITCLKHVTEADGQVTAG